jgi:hypothetical protein
MSSHQQPPVPSPPARDLGRSPAAPPPPDVQPGDVQPGDVQPGDVQPGDVQPGDVQPGDIQAVRRAGGAGAGYAGSPLDTAEQAFQLLCREPRPLSVDGARLGHGLPDRHVTLVELRDLLLSPQVGLRGQDIVWRHLVGRARSGDPAWVVGAVGVAMPGLRNVAARLSAMAHHLAADLDTELITGFLIELRAVDLCRPRVCWRIISAGYNAARRALTADGPGLPRHDTESESQVPPAPWGHPDLILVSAVARGVLTEVEARLIGVTRLERVSVSALAEVWGVDREALYSQRRRAEVRLVAAICDGQLTDVPALLTEPPGQRPDTTPRPMPARHAASSRRQVRPRRNRSGRARSHRTRDPRERGPAGRSDQYAAGGAL